MPGAVNSTPEQVRIQLGRAIRQLKAQWKLGVVLVPLLQLPAAAPLGVETGSAEASPSSGTAAAAAVGHDPGSQQGPDSTEQHVEEVRGLFSAAAAFGLEDCWQWKPLLDGKQVGAHFCSRMQWSDAMHINVSLTRGVTVAAFAVERAWY